MLKVSRKFVFMVFLSLIFFACKKNIEIVNNTNKCGSIIGDARYYKLNFFTKTSDDSYLLWGDVINPVNRIRDGCIIKLDKNFTTFKNWNLSFGGPLNDKIASLALDESDNLLLTGYTNKKDSLGVLYYPSFITYINSTGITQWENKTSFLKYHFNKVLFIAQNNSFCLVGNIVKTDTMVALDIDKNGNINWIFKYRNGKKSNSVNPEAIVNSLGEIFLNYNNPNDSCFLIKIKSNRSISDTFKYESISKIGKTCNSLELTNNDRISYISKDDGLTLNYADKNGNFEKRIYLEEFTNIFSNKDGSQIITTNLGWKVFNSKGELTKEVLLDKTKFKDLSLLKVIKNNVNEFIAYGITEELIIMRFDENGNLKY